MDVVIVSDERLDNELNNKLIAKRLNKLVKNFPNIRAIHFYLGVDVSDNTTFFEIKVTLGTESIYYKKNLTSVNRDIIEGTNILYKRLEMAKLKFHESSKKPMNQIYVVDDDDFYRKFLIANIKKTFYTSILDFDNPELCYYQMKKEKPDAVVLDYQFAKKLITDRLEMNTGLDAIDRIKKEFPETPVILISDKIDPKKNKEKFFKYKIPFVPKNPRSIGNINMLLKSYLPNMPLVNF